jgi:hypothetical protein
MAELIFSKDLHKILLEANTPQKTKLLAKKIVTECEEWRKLFYENGKKDGWNHLQWQLRGLLKAKEDDEL